MTSADSPAERPALVQQLTTQLSAQLTIQRRHQMDLGDAPEGRRWYALVADCSDQGQIDQALAVLKRNGELAHHRYIDASSPATIAVAA